MTDDKGPLLPLSRRWRWMLSIGLLGLAIAHVVWPALAIDALSVGLLGGAVLVSFFNIESFEWQGIKARRLQEVRAAGEVVEAVDVPKAAPALPLPVASEGSGAVLFPVAPQLESLDLMPPVDRLERLLWGAEQIRAELIIIAGSDGHIPTRQTWDKYRSPELAELLADVNVIPRALLEPILLLVRIRNSVVHSTTTQTPDLLESSSTLAMDVLSKLRSVKRNYVRVRHPDIMLFGDQSLTARLTVAGVMLATIDDEGTVRHIAVYPRLPNYQLGRFVSWEWSPDPTVNDEAWYRDPFTKKLSLAFSASMSFIGREFPPQWGIEYRLSRPDVGLVGHDAA